MISPVPPCFQGAPPGWCEQLRRRDALRKGGTERRDWVILSDPQNFHLIRSTVPASVDPAKAAEGGEALEAEWHRRFSEE